MKTKTFFAKALCGALLCCCAMAVPCMAEPEKQEADPNALSLKNLTFILSKERDATRRAANPAMFEDPDRDSAIKDYKAVLGHPLVNVGKNGGVVLAPGEENNRSDIVTLFQCMRTLDEDLRPHLYRVINITSAGEFVKRYDKLKKTRSYMEYDGFAEEISKFDAAWGEFIKLVDEMVANGATDVSATEVMMASRLEDFCNADARALARFDRKMRILDNYLGNTRTSVLKKLDDDMLVLRKYFVEAYQAIEKVKAEFAQNASYGKSPYYDRVTKLLADYDAILTNIAMLWDNMENFYKDALDEGTVMGKLRTCRGLAPKGSLLVAGSDVKDGHPVYVRRTRMALEHCRAYYLKAADRLNGVNRNTPGYKPITWK